MSVQTMTPLLRIHRDEDIALVQDERGLLTLAMRYMTSHYKTIPSRGYCGPLLIAYLQTGQKRWREPNVLLLSTNRHDLQVQLTQWIWKANSGGLLHLSKSLMAIRDFLLLSLSVDFPTSRAVDTLPSTLYLDLVDASDLLELLEIIAGGKVDGLSDDWLSFPLHFLFSWTSLT